MTTTGELTAGRDFAVYADGMDAGLDRKLDDLAPTISATPPGGRLVDLGCGTGATLAAVAQARPDLELVGVDCSPVLLSRAAKLLAGTSTELVPGHLQKLPIDDASLDTAIMASVLHEVYSYAGYDRDAVAAALAEASRVLRTGGRVVIRDGVAPDDGARPIWLVLHDQTLTERLARFAVEFRPAHPTPGIDVLAWQGDAARMSLHDACEFLSKAWYVENWESELQEEFGVHTADGWSRAVRHAGLDVVRSTPYVHPWVAANRYDGNASLHADGDTPGEQLDWPATTIVIEAIKRSPADHR